MRSCLPAICLLVVALGSCAPDTELPTGTPRPPRPVLSVSEDQACDTQDIPDPDCPPDAGSDAWHAVLYDVVDATGEFSSGSPAQIPRCGDIFVGVGGGTATAPFQAPIRFTSFGTFLLIPGVFPPGANGRYAWPRGRWAALDWGDRRLVEIGSADVYCVFSPTGWHIGISPYRFYDVTIWVPPGGDGGGGGGDWDAPPPAQFAPPGPATREDLYQVDWDGVLFDCRTTTYADGSEFTECRRA